MTTLDFRLTPDADVCWRTVIGEARGQCYLDMLAVAFVMRERVLAPGWWGHDWQSVCANPAQFSCWRNDDPNKHFVLDPFDVSLAPRQRCLSAALAAAHGTDQDAPVKALVGDGWLLPTHYLSGTADPAWAHAAGVYGFDVPWSSAFRFYAHVPGSPQRAQVDKKGAA